jgi:hypothetical protein
MKIFSTFNTRHRYNELWEHQALHGEDKVFLIIRSKTYYVLFFLIPIIVVFLATIATIVLISIYATGERQRYGIISASVIWGVIMLVIHYGSYLHYYLDFMIVTPEKVDIYDQRNILHRNVKSLFAHEIKWVYADQAWIIYSIFNDGNITIESYTEEHKKLFFGPVHDADNVKKRIEYVLNK